MRGVVSYNPRAFRRQTEAAGVRRGSSDGTTAAAKKSSQKGKNALPTVNVSVSVAEPSIPDETPAPTSQNAFGDYVRLGQQQPVVPARNGYSMVSFDEERLGTASSGVEATPEEFWQRHFQDQVRGSLGLLPFKASLARSGCAQEKVLYGRFMEALQHHCNCVVTPDVRGNVKGFLGKKGAFSCYCDSHWLV